MSESETWFSHDRHLLQLQIRRHFLCWWAAFWGRDGSLIIHAHLNKSLGTRCKDAPGLRLTAEPFIPYSAPLTLTDTPQQLFTPQSGYLAFANKAPPARRAFALQVHSGLASSALIFLDTPLSSGI